MRTGDTVWVRPASSDARGRVAAHIDLLSKNGRSIALRLQDKPSWFDIAGGVLLHQQDGRIELLLLREAMADRPAGPWVDAITGREYEIEEIQA